MCCVCAYINTLLIHRYSGLNVNGGGFQYLLDDFWIIAIPNRALWLHLGKLSISSELSESMPKLQRLLVVSGKQYFLQLAKNGVSTKLLEPCQGSTNTSEGSSVASKLRASFCIPFEIKFVLYLFTRFTFQVLKSAFMSINP